MPPQASSTLRPTVDDIFNYDAGIDATFNQPTRDWNVQDDTLQQQQHVPVDIDQEIKVTKKRKPVAKLDETRLLSQPGIPKLRKIAKDRLQIKGKGHEFSDMARLLNTYQLWLDDLFPKAKFMDGISMIEKLGHKKRIQMMRREWIEEGKPKPQRHEDEEDDANNHNQTPSGQEEPDEDQLDALLAESETISPSTTPKTTNAQPANDQEEPDQDELDALMAEDAMNETTTTAAAPKSLFGGPPSLATSTTRRPPDVDNFDDDEEAMAGMDW